MTVFFLEGCQDKQSGTKVADWRQLRNYDFFEQHITKQRTRSKIILGCVPKLNKIDDSTTRSLKFTPGAGTPGKKTNFT